MQEEKVVVKFQKLLTPEMNLNILISSGEQKKLIRPC